MARVKKEGKVPRNPRSWRTDITCEKKDQYDENGCGAIFEIREEDLKILYWHGTHFRHYYTATECPCCLKYNRVFSLPQNILRRVDTKENRKNAIFDGLSESIY